MRKKYYTVEKGYPVEIGEPLRFKWNKEWKVIKIIEKENNKTLVLEEVK